MKGSLGIDREIGLLRMRNVMLSLRTVIYKVQNPKIQKLGLIIYKAKNTKEIGREPRGVRIGCKRAESKSKERIKPQAKTMKKRDTKNAKGWNSKGETKMETEKSKVESLSGEPVPTEQLSGKEGTKTRGEVTKNFSKAREVTKSRSRTEGGESRSLSKNKIKDTESASMNSDKEAKRFSTTRGEAKQPMSKLSGIHKPNLRRYKSISLSSKGAYYESPNCKRKQVNLEYAHMCMSDCNLIRRCMIDGNLKLCVWNWYPRSYVVINENIVCMMYDEINIHILTIPTTKWKHHTSELRFCKMLKHACGFMRNKKICISIARVKSSVIHGLCVIKEIHAVCNTWYVFELKNQTISTHFYSKVKIQPSPQIKLWGGYGLRENRKISSTKLWKFSYLLLIFWYIGENMVVASTTNMDMEMGMVDENEINSSSQKRPTMAQVTISQKKAKGKLVVEPKRPLFWVGFQAMNWTNRSMDYPVDKMELISELIRKGMEIDEAIECQQATPSFSFVVQEEWPSKRGDGIEGQHFNLTQIPFDVEVDENGFALDYQIAISFEIGNLKVSKESVMEKVKERLKKMKIAIGSMIGEPIAIMCYHKSITSSGVVKIHLQNSKKDGTALLQGSRAFILNLDENVDRRGKVCKTYDALTLNNLLSIKIMSEKLKEKEWYNVFEDIVIEGFKRGHEYEVTNVQKKKDFDFG